MTGRDPATVDGHDAEVLTAFEGDLPAGTVTPSALRRQVRRNLPAAVVFVLVLAVWEGLVALLGIQEFILPRPSSIARSFIEDAGPIWSAGWTTLQEALGGFVVGTVAALLVALASARWVRLRRGMMPFAIAANAIPIVALAPITNAWFSITSPVSKMTVVAVMVFFPVMINAVRGLTEVDANEIELMRSMAATPRQVLRHVRVPNAFPYLFSALKVASALALIGAIVAEYFGGRQDALGPFITRNAQLFQFAPAWAAILVASIMGIALYVVILVVERMVMPWHVSLRASSDR